MNTIYVLIMVLVPVGATRPITIEAEFNSHLACTVAREDILRQAPMRPQSMEVAVQGCYKK